MSSSRDCCECKINAFVKVTCVPHFCAKCRGYCGICKVLIRTLLLLLTPELGALACYCSFIRIGLHMCILGVCAVLGSEPSSKNYRNICQECEEPPHQTINYPVMYLGPTVILVSLPLCMMMIVINTLHFGALIPRHSWWLDLLFQGSLELSGTKTHVLRPQLPSVSSAPEMFPFCR